MKTTEEAPTETFILTVILMIYRQLTVLQNFVRNILVLNKNLLCFGHLSLSYSSDHMHVTVLITFITGK